MPALLPFKRYRYFATGSGAMDETLAPTETTVGPNGVESQAVPFILFEVRLHLSAQGADSFSIALDSIEGAAHDTVLYTISMYSKTDISTLYTRFFEAGDKLKFSLPNVDEVVWGLEVIWMLDGNFSSL